MCPGGDEHGRDRRIEGAGRTNGPSREARAVTLGARGSQDAASGATHSISGDRGRERERDALVRATIDRAHERRLRQVANAICRGGNRQVVGHVREGWLFGTFSRDMVSVSRRSTALLTVSCNYLLRVNRQEAPGINVPSVSTQQEVAANSKQFFSEPWLCQIPGKTASLTWHRPGWPDRCTQSPNGTAAPSSLGATGSTRRPSAARSE